MQMPEPIDSGAQSRTPIFDLHASILSPTVSLRFSVTRRAQILFRPSCAGVQDAAKAVLEVQSYANYVKAQSETALRRMASAHPYDQVEVQEAERAGTPATGKDASLPPVTLRDGGDAVSESLLSELRKRMEPPNPGPWLHVRA